MRVEQTGKRVDVIGLRTAEAKLAVGEIARDRAMTTVTIAEVEEEPVSAQTCSAYDRDAEMERNFDEAIRAPAASKAEPGHW